jgi:hypothetical protein
MWFPIVDQVIDWAEIEIAFVKLATEISRPCVVYRRDNTLQANPDQRKGVGRD